MKKITALILAMMMIVAMSVNAGAALGKDGSEQKDVKITVVKAGDAEDTYAVTLTWEALDFTYTYGQKVWNEQTHVAEVTGGSWSDAKTITVKNDSNVAIGYEASYIDDAEKADIAEIGITDNGNGTLAAATPGNTPTTTISVRPTTQPANDEVNGLVVGQVKVLISAVNNPI